MVGRRGAARSGDELMLWWQGYRRGLCMDELSPYPLDWDEEAVEERRCAGRQCVVKR
jgi:hypothetical protein